MTKFASLCLLAYKRPDRLKECLDSLIATADFPYQLIVNLDGGDANNADYLFGLYKDGKISNLVFNGGNNRGVGRSLTNCLAIAEGDWLFKIDTDLVFRDEWLTTAIRILEIAPEVAAVSLFNYRNYDPNDTRFEVGQRFRDYHIVNDFVSSIFGFRARDYHRYVREGGFDVEDDGFHTWLKDMGDRKLAITPQDYVENTGFGIGNSVYVSGTAEHPYKTLTYHLPLLFHEQ